MKLLTCIPCFVLLSIALVGHGLGAQPQTPAPTAETIPLAPEAQPQPTVAATDTAAKVVVPGLTELLADSHCGAPCGPPIAWENSVQTRKRPCRPSPGCSRT